MSNASGISIRVHPLFWLVIGAAVLTGAFVETVLLLSLVVMHELGHVLTGRAYGWRFRALTLFPFGGVAETDDEVGQYSPREEMVVALAGPAVNGAMAGFAWACAAGELWPEAWARQFATANLWLAGFNLLPIWPLDGGRVVHAVASLACPYRLALTITFSWSAAVALLALVWAWTAPYPRLHLFLLFLWLYREAAGGYRERRMRFVRFLFARWRRGGSGPLRVVTADSSWTVLEALRHIKRGRYHRFELRAGGRGAGAVTERRLLDALFRDKAPARRLLELLEG